MSEFDKIAHEATRNGVIPGLVVFADNRDGTFSFPVVNPR